MSASAEQPKARQQRLSPYAGYRSLPLRFARDQSGTTALLFGLLVIPLTAMVGLAIDFGRTYAVQSQTQSALDAAALAAGRVAQVENTDVIAKASQAASAHFDKAKATDVVTSTIQFSPNGQNTAFAVTATSWVRTPFLSVLNIVAPRASVAGAPGDCQGNFYKCVSVTTQATAELKSGGDGDSKVEVALMVDITGSMCNSPPSTPSNACTSGTKIDALKLAAKDLVDIVLAGNQSQYNAKIALVPFADAVNVGSPLKADLIRGAVAISTQFTPQIFNCSDLQNVNRQPTSQWLRFPSGAGGCNNGTTRTWRVSTKCVTERIGNEAYTDTAPIGTNPRTLLGKGIFGPDNMSCGVAANYGDSEINTIQELSSDKDMLKRRVDKLRGYAGTAGQLGTAWAWYMLSPKWNFVLGNSASQYADLKVRNAKGAPALRKIAILMTDGDYNANYCKGVPAKNSGAADVGMPTIACNSENGESEQQARALCTAMKNPIGDPDATIEVFTVGFQVSDQAKSFLKSCATTSTQHYYDAATPESLRAAFRDIALKISSLRLTH